MIAQYPGKCSVCPRPIQPGDSIIYSKAQGSRHTGCEPRGAQAQTAPANGHGAEKPVRLTLVKDQAMIIALKYTSGKRVSSRWGAEQMFYTLVDGRVAYFPLEVAADIEALHLGTGEPFSICHHGGQNWEIERIAPAKTNGAADSHGRKETAAASTAGNPSVAPQSPMGKVNGQGEDLGAIQRRCYDAAIANALYAVEQARIKGLMVSPTFEDIRCMATSMFIGETGGRQ